MKDFDEARRERAERDRSFQIGGKTFVRRPGIRPEEAEEHGRQLREDVPSYEILDRLVIALIEPEGHSRWAEVRADATNPVTYPDLKGLVEWLITEEVGRPTQAPLLSMAGREPTGTSSTDASSSPEAEASAS